MQKYNDSAWSLIFNVFLESASLYRILELNLEVHLFEFEQYINCSGFLGLFYVTLCMCYILKHIKTILWEFQGYK